MSIRVKPLRANVDSLTNANDQNEKKQNTTSDASNATQRKNQQTLQNPIVVDADIVRLCSVKWKQWRRMIEEYDDVGADIETLKFAINAFRNENMQIGFDDEFVRILTIENDREEENNRKEENDGENDEENYGENDDETQKWTINRKSNSGKCKSNVGKNKSNAGTSTELHRGVEKKSPTRWTYQEPKTLKEFVIPISNATHPEHALNEELRGFKPLPAGSWTCKNAKCHALVFYYCDINIDRCDICGHER